MVNDKSKKCPKGKILNPKTNRCVSRTGKLGSQNKRAPKYKPPPQMFVNMLMQYKSFKTSEEHVAAYAMIERIWKDWVAQHPNVTDEETLCKMYAKHLNELLGH